MSFRKVFLIIGSLNIGGTESQLVALARGLQIKGYETSVAVFYSDGPLERDLKAAGMRIIPLKKRGRWDIGVLWRFVKVVRKERPGILLTYLGTPNIIASVLKCFLRPAHVVCCVRSSNLDTRRYGRFSRAVFWLERMLVRFADLIIVNSFAGRDHFVNNGLPADVLVVVQNGIDVDKYRPDRSDRKTLRNEWRVGDDDTLVGLVARLDPAKGHDTFIRAAALISKERDNVWFVCIGDGPAEYFTKMKKHCASAGLDGRMIWTGSREDMRSVYNALDIAVSSSISEGFSNMIAEAMACAVPCIVTDVGDSARIVGDAGIVVPPSNPEALAGAVSRVFSMTVEDKMHMGMRGRVRIIDKYSVSRMVNQTESVFKMVCSSS